MGVYTDKQQREVFHLLFLERFLKISDPRLYALKGGVNLRLFFQSPRYSEDIDLDAFGGSVQTLKKNVYKILEDPAFHRVLQTYGIEHLKLNDPAKAKQTETTQRFRLSLINESGEAFPTKIEFSRRNKAEAKNLIQELIPPVATQLYKRLSYPCPHYSGEVASAQKVHALGGRTEVQARDAFDLYILYLGGHLQKDTIQKQTSKSDREKAVLALMSLDYKSYQGQVVEYLEESSKKQFAEKKAWEELICKKILEILE